MAGELQHVIDAAALRGRDVHLQFRGELSRLRRPTLAIAGPAGYVAARADHFVPEEIGDVMESHVAGDLVPSRGGNYLWDMRVHVQTAEFVATRCQRIHET